MNRRRLALMSLVAQRFRRRFQTDASVVQRTRLFVRRCHHVRNACRLFTVICLDFGQWWREGRGGRSGRSVTCVLVDQFRLFALFVARPVRIRRRGLFFAAQMLFLINGRLVTGHLFMNR